MPVLDTGARGSLTTFAQRGIGDVLISWENEALLATKELAQGQFQIVPPSISILAEPPVAVVDKVAIRRGTTEIARAYLEYLYSKPAQEIVAKHPKARGILMASTGSSTGPTTTGRATKRRSN